MANGIACSWNPGFRTLVCAPSPYLPRLGCTVEGLPCDGSARGARVLPAAPTGGGPAAPRGGGPTASTGGEPAAPRGGGPAASRGGGPTAPTGGGPAALTGGAKVPPCCASRGRVSGVATVAGNLTAACPLCCTGTGWTRCAPAIRLADPVAPPRVPVKARRRSASAITEAQRTIALRVCCIALAFLCW
jgi:hypothetical protein